MLWVFMRVGTGAVEEWRSEMWIRDGRSLGGENGWWWRRGGRMFGSGMLRTIVLVSLSYERNGPFSYD